MRKLALTLVLAFGASLIAGPVYAQCRGYKTQTVKVPGTELPKTTAQTPVPTKDAKG